MGSSAPQDVSGFSVGDTIKMKKIHPCGSFLWTIERLGADVWIKCDKCGRHVIIDRETLYKRVKGAREQMKRNIAKIETKAANE